VGHPVGQDMPDRDAELVHDGDQGSVLAAVPGAAGAVIGVVVATLGARRPSRLLTCGPRGAIFIT
jgi:hypothetical protein